MRTYGRVFNHDGTWTWVQVNTDAQGFDDYVWIVTLIQTLLLNRGESPFYANSGIPAQQSVVQQVFPDFYITQTQQQFAPHFASLTLAKLPGRTPSYRVNATTQQGVRVNEVVPIPK